MITRLQTISKLVPRSFFSPTRAGLLHRKCACGGSSGLDGECEDCRNKRLQRRSVNGAEPTRVPPIVHQVLRSPGQPLDPQTRAFFEPRFGHDFSNVRVHTNAKAAESARAVNALSYKLGRNVVFDAGQYNPETSKGKRLLTHELTHVVQQNSGVSLKNDVIDSSDSQLEMQAYAVAEGTMQSLLARANTSKTASRLQRTPHRGRFDAAQEREAIHYTIAQGYDTKAIKLIQEVVGAFVDGIYGGGSVEKVGQWQSTHGLEPDGKVKPNTLWAVITELRRMNRDLDALHLAQLVVPTRKFVTDSADVTSLASGAPPSEPDLTEAQADALLTSLGLLSKVTKLAPPSNRYDCHGYTFLAGAAWINNDQVDAILAANGYSVTMTPTVGDIVIYRHGGAITHSGVVTAVSGAAVTQIHSKWGRLGLYSHNPGDVPPSYGTWQFYHTSRPGGALLRPKPSTP